jgi:hypothetical protein
MLDEDKLEHGEEVGDIYENPKGLKYFNSCVQNI